MIELPILYKGSVKNVMGVIGNDSYYFEYSDDYSVFDWGKMPDEIKDKGEALTKITLILFKLLNQNLSGYEEEYNILKALNFHHHLKFDEDDISEILLKETNQVKVKAFDIIRPQKKSNLWDYSLFEIKPINVLVPLEVIFRFKIVEGSSILTRNSDVLVGSQFKIPIIEFSTKLEDRDRYVTYKEAKEMASLSDLEFEKLIGLTKALAAILSGIFSDIDIDLIDGKFEFGFSSNNLDQKDRDFMLVDSIGPDELRLEYRGVELSKEVIRSFYRDTKWYEDINAAKEKSLVNALDWKSEYMNQYKTAPPILDNEVKNLVSSIYKLVANELSRKYFNLEVFKDLPSLSDFFKGENK